MPQQQASSVFERSYKNGKKPPFRKFLTVLIPTDTTTKEVVDTTNTTNQNFVLRRILFTRLDDTRKWTQVEGDQFNFGG